MMFAKRMSLLACALLAVICLTSPAQAMDPAEIDKLVKDDTGYQSLFNGKDLTGWEGDKRFWSVRDGIVTGESSKEVPVPHNTFLIWRDGEVDDFVLKFKYRVDGNSGIQYRSEEFGNFRIKGYQADFESGPTHSGILYDEGRGRGTLAARGQKTFINEKGKWNIKPYAQGKGLQQHIKQDDWNDYTIIARGHNFVHVINGVRMSEVVDEQKSHAVRKGLLALQMHQGDPMKVEVKDVRLKRLKLEETKKIVMVAGSASHGYGAHEHNAGVKLLQKRLNEMPGVLAVAYHHAGWPRDTTAFDNADSILLYMDGGSKHPVIPHVEELNNVLRRGVGLMCMHYAVDVPPGVVGDHFKQWLGGYYETNWSTNPHWLATTELNSSHPITRGVKPFEIQDEWYYNMRFRDQKRGVVDILSAKPDDEARSGRGGWPKGARKHITENKGRSEALMWAVERADGGRGVGFTGSHVHRNWKDDNFRKLVLNALVWSAGAEVPAEGVANEAVSEEEVLANQDYPMPKKK